MKIIQQSLLLVVLCIGYSCATQNEGTKEDDFKTCDSNLAPKNIEIDKDSIISIGDLYTDVIVFKNLKYKKYFVKKRAGKIVLKNLNYFGRIDGGFQALT